MSALNQNPVPERSSIQDPEPCFALVRDKVRFRAPCTVFTLVQGVLSPKKSALSPKKSALSPKKSALSPKKSALSQHSLR